MKDLPEKGFVEFFYYSKTSLLYGPELLALAALRGKTR